MTITTLSSRELNQDVTRAKKATKGGPVFITDRGVRYKLVKRTGDFLVDPDAPVVARDRSAADALLRRPEMIAPAEWEEAIITVVQRHFGVRESELPGAVARWLGFSSTSAAIRDRVEAETKKAMKAGRLRLHGELLEAV